jgi:hypothetical protein
VPVDKATATEHRASLYEITDYTKKATIITDGGFVTDDHLARNLKFVPK